MMNSVTQRILIILLTVYLTLTASALSQSGGEYDLSWFTIDGGGTTSFGGDYKLECSIGQHDAGPLMSGGEFTLVGGFLPAPYIPLPFIPGDINGDYVVNIEDLAILAAQWLTRGGTLSADLVFNHIVDFQDLAVVAENWEYDAR